MGGRSRACGQESKGPRRACGLARGRGSAPRPARPVLVRRPRRSAQLQTALLAQINVFRAEHGLVPPEGLRRAERGRRRPLGPDGEARLLQPRLGERPVLLAADRAGYRRAASAAGRLARTSSGADPTSVPRARSGSGFSPPHRANLLNARWREVGLGAVHSLDAPPALWRRRARRSSPRTSAPVAASTLSA